MPLGANKAAIMGVAGASAAADVVLLQTQTADGDASITFDSGIDSTYGEYIFGVYNFNPSANGSSLDMQCNAASATGYNEQIQSTSFKAVHSDDDTTDAGTLSYDTSRDQANGTSNQLIIWKSHNAASANANGIIHLFNPASTTYVKHFICRSQSIDSTSPAYSTDSFIAGYINTTTAIDDIKFSSTEGTFDGVIKMWGVK